ncbi:MAG: hypothetical protein LBQ04_02265 [Endomicrobium sp.]|nr:hypothetical protein [Endomicrobium sp.]
MSIVGPVQIAIEKYKLNVTHLAYNISWHAIEYRHFSLDRDKIDTQIAKFMKEDSSNVKFFVISKHGDIIYKNNPLSNIVQEGNAKDLDNQVWNNSLKVMQKNKSIIFEEADKERIFLSVKSPLILDGKVEGVIGLAVDITDRKKREELENKLKMREELYKVAKEVSHDIASPVTSLKIIEEVYKWNLTEQDERMLNTAIRSIEGMAGKKLDKYRIERNREEERGAGDIGERDGGRYSGKHEV